MWNIVKIRFISSIQLHWICHVYLNLGLINQSKVFWHGPVVYPGVYLMRCILRATKYVSLELRLWATGLRYRGSKGPWPLAPGPCPLTGLMKNRQVDITKIKSLLQKRQTPLYPRHEWLAIVVRGCLWNVFISLCNCKKSSIGNTVWAGTTCRWKFLLR